MTTPLHATLINPMARHLDAIGGPIRVAHAEGVRLYDDTGRSWIDCETGTGVFSLGHRHPEVMEALDRDLDLLDLGNHHLISYERAQLARYLNRTIFFASSEILANKVHTFHQIGWTDERAHSLEAPPNQMRCVFNVSSGEAIDSAIKLARGATGKTTIVCADNSYHGSTGYALAASAPSLSAHLPGRPPGFVHVPYGPIDAIAHEFEKHDDIASVLLEPIAIEAGCVVPPDGYLENVYGLCRGRGALVILDESVTGLGRTGTAFAFTQQNAFFDIVTVGRALGGGIYPMYATCHREELDSFYVRNPFVHVSTFGGGEVGCFAARTALYELIADSVLENVRKRGAEFRKAIAKSRTGAGAHVRDVRGVGLANAVEFYDARTARAVQSALFERGVWCRTALLAPQSLLFLPPLTISSDEIAAVIEAFEPSLTAAASLQ
jgi:acetylornithine/succinyldiaminopimelate/putrescine aminotransferase